MKILQQRLDSERRLLAEKMEREKAELGRAQSVVRAAAIGRKCVNSFLIGRRSKAGRSQLLGQLPLAGNV